MRHGHSLSQKIENHQKETPSMRKTILFVLALFVSGFLFTLPTTQANANKPPAKQVTFTKDVAPILYKSCAECHRAGEVAPFSVLSYKDVRPWAKSIKEQVVNKTMPPWHADPHHGEWKNDRRLTQAEIDTIAAWVNGGAPEGNAKDLPVAPKYPDGWGIGQPDVKLSVPEQSIPATGVVAYQYVKVKTNFTEDKWIQAAEIRSTGRDAVHHVIAFIQAPGIGQGGEQSLLCGYAPGEQPAIFPAGMAKKVPAGAEIMFQLHYTPNGKATEDVTTLGLVFAKEPVKNQLLTRGILTMKFEIPAGAANHEVRSQYTFMQDGHITSFMPHMHLRGKDFVYIAHFPDGTKKTLLNVPKYDFNWQTYYVPKEPIAVPKGTRLECIAHYDNSTANKFNPDPTKVVKWGDQTWEEMMIGWIGFYHDNAPKPTASAGSTSGQ
jgi:mono/diheme cytochrome c family protein